MAKQARRDTRPERELRSLLHSLCLRYVTHFRAVEGVRLEVDIAFRGPRVAVFVDGCFWHACPEHGPKPRVNADYWSSKLARNVERDREANALLENAGWEVIRIWEHDVNPGSACNIAQRVRARDLAIHRGATK